MFRVRVIKEDERRPDMHFYIILQDRINYVDTQVIFMLIKSSGPHRSPEKQFIEKKKVL